MDPIYPETLPPRPAGAKGMAGAAVFILGGGALAVVDLDEAKRAVR